MPLDLLQIAEELGYQVEKTGAEYKAICLAPKHKDTSPSMSLNTEKQVWYCFGCSVGGGPIQLITHTRPEVDYIEAFHMVWGEEGEGNYLQSLLSSTLTHKKEDRSAFLFWALLSEYKGKNPDDIPIELLDCLLDDEPGMALLTYLERNYT